MQKSPSVAYFCRKIETTGRTELFDFLEDAPISVKDYAFITDVIYGFTIAQLAAKYHKSQSRISKWKRQVFERLHRFELSTR